jgi:hypothetical protein
MAAQAGASLRDGLRNVQIIIFLRYTFHREIFPLSPDQTGMFSVTPALGGKCAQNSILFIIYVFVEKIKYYFGILARLCYFLA